MWSNFGYSLGVISLKNDDYDQLLVGAPLYTEWGNPDHIPDQGVVYQFYYSSDTQKFEKHDIVLDGSRQAYARFGSAISNIGDINLDQFPDIAIGAPGENDNAGSIYIYLGSATGLSNSYSQRIQASQFKAQVKGFGFALSNKQFPKNKTYPVFAASSVVSKTVAVFQCRPIVEVEVQLTATPNPVDTKLSCTKKDVSACFESIASLKSQINRDRFTPINVVAEYSLEQNQSSANEPVLDATKANNKTIEVTFVNECGTDGKCEVNLILNADLHIQPASQWPYIVVNHTKELTVEIGVINKAETAYGVTANIEIDTFVILIRAKSDHSCEPGTISTNVTDINLVKDKTLITCNFFEPLDPTGHLKFNVVFDTDQDNVKKNYLQIKVDVMPKNPAHNPEISQDNNLKIMQKKVFIISDITLASLSTPNDHTKSKSQESEKKSELLNVTHKILVKNQGPSFLPTTKISVAIPFYLKDDVQLMLTEAGEALCKSTSNTGAIIEPSTTTHFTTEQSTKEWSLVMCQLCEQEFFIVSPYRYSSLWTTVCPYDWPTNVTITPVTLALKLFCDNVELATVKFLQPTNCHDFIRDY
ncbi:Integrin alpha-4, partial [Bulinus truncatus]